jgi:hypothetical protein
MMIITCDRCGQRFPSWFFWHMHIGFHWTMEKLEAERKERDLLAINR